MNISPEYQAALDWLFSFVDNSRTHAANLAPENFDLSRVFALMDLLENPHDRFKSIHIAGTKGKGSVAAYCASILNAAGFKTGLFTSPHMQDYRERIQINGRMISESTFVSHAAEIKPFIEKIPKITTFEIGTALAFWHFAREGVDYAVIEVGLGGKLDATNVVTPEVSVITPISFDHVPILGTTLEEIAGEKAGIIKENIPVVIAPQPPEAHKTLMRTAIQRNASPTVVGRDLLYTLIKRDLEGQSFFIYGAEFSDRMEAYLEGAPLNGWRPLLIRSALLGDHQMENAVTAISAIKELIERGAEISDEQIVAGIADTKWPGRFEILQHAPYLVLDAAHNVDSAEKLRSLLDDVFPENPVVLVFGTLGDKNLSGMFEALLPRANEVIATQSIHPRSMDPETIAAQARGTGKSVRVSTHIEGALSQALDLAENNTVILVTGSVAFTGAAKTAWEAMHR